MTTLLPYQTTELSDEIDPCEKSRLGEKPAEAEGSCNGDDAPEQVWIYREPEAEPPRLRMSTEVARRALAAPSIFFQKPQK